MKENRSLSLLLRIAASRIQLASQACAGLSLFVHGLLRREGISRSPVAHGRWHISQIGLIVMMGVSMTACSDSREYWNEEVLLHDGSKIIVERSVVRGGRHEIGQRPPIKEQSLSFVLPSTTQRVSWEDNYSEDIRAASFLPMQVEIFDKTPYLIASPMGCLSYNKWGRPNPPYVIFKYDGKAWQRISLQELPAESKMPNLVISSPDDAAKEANQGVVSAEKIKKLNSGFRQPEFKTILREPLPEERIKDMCEERVLYKGSWILPNDPIARKFIDQQKR